MLIFEQSWLTCSVQVILVEKVSPRYENSSTLSILLPGVPATLTATEPTFESLRLLAIIMNLVFFVFKVTLFSLGQTQNSTCIGVNKRHFTVNHISRNVSGFPYC